MQPTPAMIVTEEQLEELLKKAGYFAAITAIEKLKTDLFQDPRETQLKQLKEYVEDRTSVDSPREMWADSKLIRQIEPNSKNKPKSISWFQKFKKESNLDQCLNRKATTHGKCQEWCFEDIANAWDHYHRQRWLRG